MEDAAQWAFTKNESKQTDAFTPLHLESTNTTKGCQPFRNPLSRPLQLEAHEPTTLRASQHVASHTIPTTASRRARPQAAVRPVHDPRPGHVAVAAATHPPRPHPLVHTGSRALSPALMCTPTNQRPLDSRNSSSSENRRRSRSRSTTTTTKTPPLAPQHPPRPQHPNDNHDNPAPHRPHLLHLAHKSDPPNRQSPAPTPAHPVQPRLLRASPPPHNMGVAVPPDLRPAQPRHSAVCVPARRRRVPAAARNGVHLVGVPARLARRVRHGLCIFPRRHRHAVPARGAVGDCVLVGGFDGAVPVLSDVEGAL